jgi:xanthine dehydrogenase accessory factor
VNGHTLCAVDEVVRRIGRWRADGRQVTVARLLAVQGVSGHDSVWLAGFTPGEAPAGRVLSGALDAELAVPREQPQVLRLAVDDTAADRSGMSCGGSAQVLVQPADTLPDEAWDLIAAREPVCLVTDLATGSTIVHTRAHPPRQQLIARLFARGSSEGALVDGAAVTAIWPVAKLVVVGEGLIADALVAAAGLLGWVSEVVNDAAAAQVAIGQLASGDGVVVLSHDRAVDGPALAAALAGSVGYVGALGARHTQAARADWLASRGQPVTARVRGPAGLDLGARTPAEIAVSIVAELLAVRSGRDPVPLSARSGPVHGDGLNAPPPRYPFVSGRPPAPAGGSGAPPTASA